MVLLLTFVLVILGPIHNGNIRFSLGVFNREADQDLNDFAFSLVQMSKLAVADLYYYNFPPC